MATAWPFQRLFRDLGVQIEAVRIDGDLAPAELIDQTNHAIQIRGVGRDSWKTADIDVAVDLPVQELRTRGIDDDKINVLAQLRCDATDLRATERLRSKNGKAQGTISFKRDLVADRLTLTTIVSEDGADGIPRILKESRWDIVVATLGKPRTPRKPRGPGLHEIFNVRWCDFNEEKQLKPYASDLYFVDVGTPERPSLYLNRSIENYPALLSDRPGGSFEERALRDLEYRRVCLGAWSAAALHALDGVTIDDATGEISLPEGWRKDVLDWILPRLRPNQPADLTARAIARARSDGEGYALVLGQVQSCINQVLDVSSVLRRHLNEIGKTPSAGSDS